MSTLEIVLVSLVSGFAFVLILKLIGANKLKSGEKKEKKSKPAKEKKPKKVKEKKTKQKKTKEKNVIEEKPAKEEKPKKEKAFSITKKGVAKINKNAINRDSRSGAIIEKAIVKGGTTNINDTQSQGYDSFDDLLNKIKSIGDPDELDDETFRRMFMSNMADDIDDMPESELSSSFVSLESPTSGKVDRRLKHFTIDGSHLDLDKRFDDLPSRRPTIKENIEFTSRISGRYNNITMGDISNRLEISDDLLPETKDIEIEEEQSDEDIFAKIMERRRRELGIEPLETQTDSDTKEIVITPETLVVADAILKPKSRKF